MQNALFYAAFLLVVGILVYYSMKHAHILDDDDEDGLK